ncbi:hypothetical protein COOONC_08515 [Cooperia oncophora]
MVVERPVNDDAIASMKGFLEAACKRSAPVSPVKKPPDATVPEMRTAIERRDRNIDNLIKRENERRSKSQTGAFKENSVLDNNSNERHSSQRKRSSIKEIRFQEKIRNSWIINNKRILITNEYNYMLMLTSNGAVN